MSKAKHPMPQASDRALARLEELGKEPPAFRFIENEDDNGNPPVIDVQPIDDVVVDLPEMDPVVIVDVADDPFYDTGFDDGVYYTIA